MLLNRYGLFVLVISLLFNAKSTFPQVTWQEYSSNPILEPTTGWESGVILSPNVIVHNDTLKMWYAGSTSLFNPLSIGYAWSLDGINWTKHSGNPVLSGRAGEWDDQGVALPIVILDGDTLRMWYGGGGLSPDDFDIGYAVSVDGINWTRFPNPAIQRGSAGEWNADILLTGAVIKESGVYKMWFTGGIGSVSPANQNTKTSIGYATSPDGLNWTIYDDPSTTNSPYEFSDPVIEHGSTNEWDANEVLSSSVVNTSLEYQLWYSGWKSGSTQNIGYASSSDGIEWVKYGDNPVFNAPGTWTNEIVFPSVLFDSSTYRMWFQGWQGVTASFGYATAPITSLDQNSQGSLYDNFKLEQNYPNPFNPVTRINYSIKESDFISIKVFNIIGEEVANLVNEVKIPGSYSVEFDAISLPSEIYFYSLRTNSFMETKKMILMK